MRGALLCLSAVVLVASGCWKNPDECNARFPNNVHLTLVDATTQAPVYGHASVVNGLYGGIDDCQECGGCSTLSVIVVDKQTVLVSADGYAEATLAIDAPTGSGQCGLPFKQVNVVVQMTPQPGATYPVGDDLVCMDMGIPTDLPLAD